MAFTIEKFQRDPIILLTAGADWSSAEFERVLSALTWVLDASERRLHLVADLRGLSLEYVELLQGIRRMTRGRDALLRHPRLKSLVVVADDPIVLQTARGLNEPEYSGVSVTVTTRLAEALLGLNVRGLSSALKDKIPT